MTQPLAEIADQLIAAARSAGADSADALVVSGASLSIDVRMGQLEQAERAESTDIGLRVMLGKRQANVSASDVSAHTISQLAERAVAMARIAPEDPYIGLAEASELATDLDHSDLDLVDPSEEPSPDALGQEARDAEAAALASNGVSQVQSSSATYGRRSVQLATSNGFAGGYTSTGSSISCVAICGEGTDMERDYDFDTRAYRSDLRSATDIGQEAARRAVSRSGARKPETGTFPILFDERIAGSLIGHLLQAANGAAVARGSSWLKDHLSKPVLPEALSLTENPRRARVQGSRKFDAEGLATKPREIVKDGVLTGWTLDLATGRKLGLPSTANASRSVSGGPSPSVTHVALTQGNQSQADLLRDMGTGLLVTSMIGSTINPNTGDYSRGASGFWVQDGEIQYPVNECTIAGNLLDMLGRLIPANDARQDQSRVVPSLLIDGLTLAGN